MKYVTVEIQMDTDLDLNDHNVREGIERTILGYSNEYDLNTRCFLEVTVTNVEED